jgi:hypothetical protein
LATAIYFAFKKKEKLMKKFENKNLSLWAFGLAFSVIALLPFIGLGNISERYIYLSSVGMCLLFVMGFSGLCSFAFSKYSKKTATVIFICVVTGICVFFAINTKAESAQWKKAGQITKDTLAILKANHENVNTQGKIFFVNLPIRYKNAWVYPVGIEDSVWFVYRESAPKIILEDTVENAKKASGAFNTTSYIYSFDKNYNISEVR